MLASVELKKLIRIFVVLSFLRGYIASRGGSKGGGAPGARPPKIGKKYDFWRKIVIFHTKYPNNFFKYAPPNLKSWIRPGFNISFYVNPFGDQTIRRFCTISFIEFLALIIFKIP
jgi:hypothetical protein